MQETGDPLQWVAIARLNGLTDPWIVGLTDILIPPVFPDGEQTGILDASYAAPGFSTSHPLRPTTANPPSAGAPMLDFSDPANSQYLPMV